LSVVEREKPEKPRSDSWKPTLYLYSGQCWEDVTLGTVTGFVFGAGVGFTAMGRNRGNGNVAAVVSKSEELNYNSQLNRAFQGLVSSHQYGKGKIKITPLVLMNRADPHGIYRVSGKDAEAFLADQAKQLQASFEISDGGTVVYVFE